MCKIPKMFTNFMKDIDNSIFGYKFLLFCYIRLTKELLKLIDHNKKDCIDCFLNEYVSRGRDYTTATSWCDPLS